METSTWRLTLSNGALEGLKWLALVSMTYDHVVRALLTAGGVGNATAFGRLAFPLFAFILAYNLARPGIDAQVYQRVLIRLALFGFLAQPFAALIWRFDQLNILFSLALGVLVIWLIEERKRWFALPTVLVLFFLAPAVEYSWHGLLLIVSLYLWCKEGVTVFSTLILALGFTALGISNGTQWGLLALPAILLATRLTTLEIPRMKWLFYVYYPAHLALIVVLMHAL